MNGGNENTRGTLTASLPQGSIVIERYVYASPITGHPGVQWLAQKVDRDGSLALFAACRTRKQALKEAGRV